MTTNNKVESFVMFQGLMLLKEQGMSQMTIISDLSIVVRALSQKCSPLNLKLSCMIQIIINLSLCFEEISFFQVLRTQNGLGSMSQGNLGMQLGGHKTRLCVGYKN
jgi:hypothetical protein